MAGGWGWVIGSARPLLCSFGRNGAPPERYVGTMYKLGLDLGYTQGGALIWSVIAPSANLGPGTLAGSYAGGTASATVGFGVGANGLVGGFFNSVMLQPLSIETNQGVNVAAGVAAMTLRPGQNQLNRKKGAPPPPHPNPGGGNKRRVCRPPTPPRPPLPSRFPD